MQSYQEEYLRLPYNMCEVVIFIHKPVIFPAADNYFTASIIDVAWKQRSEVVVQNPKESLFAFILRITEILKQRYGCDF